MQVTIAKEIKPEWCNTDMEVFVQDYSESMKTNEDENETFKESLFFAYHGEILSYHLYIYSFGLFIWFIHLVSIII